MKLLAITTSKYISISLGCFGSGDQLAEKVSPSRGAHMGYLRGRDKVEESQEPIIF